MTTDVKLYSLDFSAIRTYLIALAFVAGNIVLPQLCHTVHMGGPTWLPIYFFTLLAAYKYGIAAGLFTAVASPVTNCLLFGMPAEAALPAILIKSVLLALIAAFAAHRSGRVSLAMLAAVVLGYQVTGTLCEWALKSDLWLAAQDFRIGIPGMLVQVFGGWAVLKYILRK